MYKYLRPAREIVNFFINTGLFLYCRTVSIMGVGTRNWLWFFHMAPSVIGFDSPGLEGEWGWRLFKSIAPVCCWDIDCILVEQKNDKKPQHNLNFRFAEICEVREVLPFLTPPSPQSDLLGSDAGYRSFRKLPWPDSRACWGPCLPALRQASAYSPSLLWSTCGEVHQWRIVSPLYCSHLYRTAFWGCV